MLAHCAYFGGDVTTGLIHSDHEIARPRASGDPYRLSYVLADSGTHAANGGDTQLGLERAVEALRLAEQINNPAVMSMAQLAHGFAHRADDPARSIEWFRRASDLADTVDSTWTATLCRVEPTCCSPSTEIRGRLSNSASRGSSLFGAPVTSLVFEASSAW